MISRMRSGRSVVLEGLGAIIACSVVGIAIVTTAPTPLVPTGTYRCTGESAGQPYVLGLTIAAAADVYHTAWFDAQGVTQYGYGVLKDDRFAVVIVNARGDWLAVGLYTVEAGALRGVWSGGDEKVYPETCLRAGERSARGGRPMEQWRVDLDQYRRMKALGDRTWAQYLTQRTVSGYTPMTKLHDAGLTDVDRSWLRCIRVQADG